MEKYRLLIDVKTPKLTFHETDKIFEGLDTYKIEIYANTAVNILVLS
jgi:hypothetical protein